MKIYPIPRIEIMPLQEVEEKRPVLLVTSGPAWQAVESLLHLPVACRVEPVRAEIDAWQPLEAEFREVYTSLDDPVIYTVGGGLAADTGKYLASRLDLPLIVVPTALTVDAFFTWTSGIRRDGCVQYIETRVADRLLVDLKVIGEAPPHLRAAGITDVLSIATGSWDWRYAQESSMNPPGMEFIPYIFDTAQAILSGVMDCAEAAGRGDPQGLKQLLDCLAMVTQVCNQVGHARPEEGSEHYFAYAVENYTGPGLPHCDLVGPGILIAAGLQGQVVADLRRALKACNVCLDRITDEAQRETLLHLPEYVKKHKLPFGIVHTIKMK